MRRNVATLFFVQSQNDMNGSYVPAVTPSVTAQFRRSRRNVEAEQSCPKCTSRAWSQPTEAGHTLYRCQNLSCGKTWVTDCRHSREIRYLTAGGVDMARCTICGKRRKLPETKPNL